MSVYASVHREVFHVNVKIVLTQMCDFFMHSLPHYYLDWIGVAGLFSRMGACRARPASTSVTGLTVYCDCTVHYEYHSLTLTLSHITPKTPSPLLTVPAATKRRASADLHFCAGLLFPRRTCNLDGVSTNAVGTTINSITPLGCLAGHQSRCCSAPPSWLCVWYRWQWCSVYPAA